ncbi:cell envelope integrity protein CreD [Uliginosibacterium sp. H3]|uniref:Cell envelope integrity protein CreD n=1 Tax=Uliginosibacterium silvisoli TaxID=3114758 RepID=A0ABU6JZE0_9RHOO|nr:cell envelope integrity protein CreD [Uliginosibacterium sp. H3]
MKSFASKMLTVCAVGLLLLVAGMLLRSVVNDRLQNLAQARASITNSLAAEQTIAGVTLVIPYVERYQETITDERTKLTRVESRRVEHQFEVLPAHADLTGMLTTDPHRRGLFRVNGYILNGRLSGDFAMPAAELLPRNKADSALELRPARMVLGISDPRGIRRLEMKLNDVVRNVEPGTGAGSATPGAHAVVGGVLASLGSTARFDVDLELVGTDSLNIVPLGRESTAALNSTWKHPSFGGRFLPTESHVGNGGFDAKWRVSSLATNARTSWKAAPDGRPQSAESFSVSLIEPVDIYVMSDRAGKYASLFVGITLGGFLLFELLRSLRLHPLHYLLIGAALLIFFLLLLALSEQLGFGRAYAIASSACVLLIGIYSINLLRSKWLALGFTIGLGALYGALYVILLSEQNALLMGSLLIFALLAAVMLGTRKVDWHALLAERPVTPRVIEEHQYE